MPNYKEKLDTEWLKAKVNVEDGDRIRILSDQENDEGNVIIVVGVIQNGELVKQKKFQLNRTNLKTVMDTYGFDSENWHGKEMTVNIVRVRNPKTGEKVDSIELDPPFDKGTGLERTTPEEIPFG